MRVANAAGRSTLLAPDGAGLDIAKASDGVFPADPQALHENWDAFRDWAVDHQADADADFFWCLKDPAKTSPSTARTWTASSTTHSGGPACGRNKVAVGVGHAATGLLPDAPRTWAR